MAWAGNKWNRDRFDTGLACPLALLRRSDGLALTLGRLSRLATAKEHEVTRFCKEKVLTPHRIDAEDGSLTLSVSKGSLEESARR